MPSPECEPNVRPYAQNALEGPIVMKSAVTRFYSARFFRSRFTISSTSTSTLAPFTITRLLSLSALIGPRRTIAWRRSCPENPASWVRVIVSHRPPPL